MTTLTSMLLPLGQALLNRKEEWTSEDFSGLSLIFFVAFSNLFLVCDLFDFSGIFLKFAFPVILLPNAVHGGNVPTL